MALLDAHVVEWLCMGREDGFSSLTILEIRDLHFLVDIILGFSTLLQSPVIFFILITYRNPEQ